MVQSVVLERSIIVSSGEIVIRQHLQTDKYMCYTCTALTRVLETNETKL